MDNSIFSLKKDARLAGLFYLLHIATIIYGVIFVSSKLGISGTDEMANNILANEFLFRTGIVSRISGLIPTLLLAFALYRLLENVNIRQAKFMFALILISIPFQFIAEVFNISSLMIAKGELLKSLDSQQRHDFTVLFINIYNNTVSISQMFWGLWLFPLSLLIYKSKFLPRLFGVILFLGGVCYLIDYTTFLFFPIYRSVTVIALLVGFICEISIMFWLIIKGVKNQFGT
jgi:Domain of unknown function (DUF4386)